MMWKWVAEKIWRQLEERFRGAVDAEIVRKEYSKPIPETCLQCGLVFVSNEAEWSYCFRGSSPYYGVQPQPSHHPQSGRGGFCPICWPAENERLELAKWAKANPEQAAKCKARWDKEQR